MIVEKDKVKVTISDLLKSHPEGLSIADIMKMTGLARHTVLARLHGLIGADHVGVRKVNMAKLHSWKAKEEEETEPVEKAKLVGLEEKHIKRKAVVKKAEEPLSKKINMSEIKQEIEERVKEGKIKKTDAELFEQRAPLVQALNDSKEKQGKVSKNYVLTGIDGFDQLLAQGIPAGSSILVSGGAGSGKTIFCLQTLINKAREGKKCFYMSFEENEKRLIEHMEGFGWNPQELIKKGKLRLQRMNPFDITRNVDALLAQQKGELLIEVDPVIMPTDFAHPDFIVIDSLTAIASAFTGKEDSYRIYIEQLFRFLEKTGATSFLITETEQVPKIFSQTGVEEFLADGVIVLYALKHGNVRENAIEMLKLRGASHKKNIVAMQITPSGIVIYPEQEVFSEI
jgi:circadian clock protein KaiC